MFEPFADSLFGRGAKQTPAQKAFLLTFTRRFSAFKQRFGYGASQNDFKCTFDTTGRESQLRGLNMTKGMVQIDAARIRDEIFMPVVAQIKNLLNEQLDRAALVGHSVIDFVYLVGGFGNSPFLYGALEEMFLHQETRVVCVPKSQLTISVTHQRSNRGELTFKEGSRYVALGQLQLRPSWTPGRAQTYPFLCA